MCIRDRISAVVPGLSFIRQAELYIIFAALMAVIAKDVYKRQAVMIAGILMVLTGCFRNVEAAYKTINWESIVLIAAMLPM